MMSKEQIDGLIQFIEKNAQGAVGYAMTVMDAQGQVQATFSCNVIQLAFMTKVMDDACSKMIATAPGPAPVPHAQKAPLADV